MNQETKQKISEAAKKQKRNVHGQFEVDTREVQNVIAGLFFFIGVIAVTSFFAGRWYQSKDNHVEVSVDVVSPLPCDK